MLSVGLTGGIASGKSSVMRLLQEHGAITFSADEAARAILAPNGSVLTQIRQAFGENVLHPDGTLNRSQLASIVFSDPEARQTLNQITHPPILRLLSAQIESVHYELTPQSIVVTEMPLLYEDHLEHWFDRVVVVTSNEAKCLSRLQERNKLTPEQAKQRLQAQLPLQEKTARADIVIENNSDYPALVQATQRLWYTLQGLLAQKSFEI